MFYEFVSVCRAKYCFEVKFNLFHIKYGDSSGEEFPLGIQDKVEISATTTPTALGHTYLQSTPNSSYLESLPSQLESMDTIPSRIRLTRKDMELLIQDHEDYVSEQSGQ